MIDWTAVRAEFPAASRYTYLNTAGAPPASRRAALEGQRYYEEMLRGGDLGWNDWLGQVEVIRERVARFINAGVDEIGFTFSSSHAFNLLASLLGEPGHVVAMADEFPSATLPWLQRGDRISFVRSGARGAIVLDDIDTAIEPSTRAVVSSSVMYRTGFRQDLESLGNLCGLRGVTFAVDASQSMGAIPIDVRRAHVGALAFSGYKWTMAGYGIAVLYISRELLAGRRLPVAGWFSARDPEAVINDRLDLKSTAAAVEVGCPHFAGIFALGGALELLNDIGQPAIEDRIHELTDRLHARLIERRFEIASPVERHARAGITIVRADDAPTLVDALAREGIIVSARGAGIRVSLHVFNNEADIDRFVDVLSTLRDRDRPVPDKSANGPVVCID
jgi:selenocysteine lyase/cysteine desulfurase